MDALALRGEGVTLEHLTYADGLTAGAPLWILIGMGITALVGYCLGYQSPTIQRELRGREMRRRLKRDER